MLENAQIVRYDLKKFPFIEALENSVFRVRPLAELHLHWRQQKYRRHGTEELGYADNLALRELMQVLPHDSSFMRIYHLFVRRVLSPLYGGKISYSNRPKMRIHLAGTPAVSSWHKDVDITGRRDQINVFLPFTRCFGTNTLWCESQYGAKDYRPLEIEPGEALLFDGGYLEHGTVANDTDVTRCSLDFRFAPTRPDIPEPWSRILSGRPETLRGRPDSQVTAS